MNANILKIAYTLSEKQIQVHYLQNRQGDVQSVLKIRFEKQIGAKLSM